MKIFLVTLVFFGLAAAGMAIGVIVSNRRIKGSCGGLAGVMDENGEPYCELCGRPAASDCMGPPAEKAEATAEG